MQQSILLKKFFQPFRTIVIGLMLTLASQAFGQEKEYADSLMNICIDFLKSAKLDSAKSTAEQMQQYSKEKDYHLGIIQSYGLLTNIYQRQGNNAKAIMATKSAISYIEKTGNKTNMAISHMNIGSILYKDGQYEEALRYMNMADDYFLEIDDKDMLITVNFNLSSIYIKLEKPLEEILEKVAIVEEITRSKKDTANLFQVLNNKGLAYVKNKKNIPEAIKCFEESLLLQRVSDANKPVTKGFSYAGLGDAYLLLKKYDLALQYNDSALTFFTKMKYNLGLRDTYKSRKDIMSSKGNYKEAFKALSELTLHLDTLYDEQRSRQLNMVRTEYETERKEAEIASLSQQASIQALEIKQKNQALIIGIIFFLFVLAVIYFVIKQRTAKRQQAQVEIEQRFLRSQLNPHFIFNALLAIQNFMLKNDAQKAALYLSKFSKLMREILENSRQEFIPVRAEIEMLTNYLDIHKLRLNNAFDYQIEVEDQIDPDSDTIPPMFVQPFVENAIEHGVSGLEHQGNIQISFTKKGEHIEISVSDNGRGLTNTSNTGKPHTSLASTIIQERIDLINRTLKIKIDLMVKNLKNEEGEIIGTQTQLKVPYAYL